MAETVLTLLLQQAVLELLILVVVAGVVAEELADQQVVELQAQAVLASLSLATQDPSVAQAVL